jgi:ubiquitin-protein ligase
MNTIFAAGTKKRLYNEFLELGIFPLQNFQFKQYKALIQKELDNECDPIQKESDIFSLQNSRFEQFKNNELIQKELKNECELIQKELDNKCVLILAFKNTYPFSQPNIFLIEWNPFIKNKNIKISQSTYLLENGMISIDMLQRWSPQNRIANIIDEVTKTLNAMIKKEKDTFCLRMLYLREVINMSFMNCNLTTTVLFLLCNLLL